MEAWVWADALSMGLLDKGCVTLSDSKRKNLGHVQLTIAVDPSVANSGVAWSHAIWPPGERDASLGSRRQSLHLPLAEVGVLLNEIAAKAHKAAEVMVTARKGKTKKSSRPIKVELIIEKPETGRGRRGRHTYSMQPVLSAKKQWIQAVKKRFSRGAVTVHEYTPSEWRAILGGRRGARREDWKSIAMQAAQIDHPDEAEAWCLMEYHVAYGGKKR